MHRRVWVWSLWACFLCLLAAGCGGGGADIGTQPGLVAMGDASGDASGGTLPPPGSGGETTPPPGPGDNEPPAPSSVRGIWRDPRGPSVLAVNDLGLTYGLLVGSSGADIVRGQLTGQDGQVPNSPFDTVSLTDGQARRIGLMGGYEPRALMRLDRVPDDGSDIALAFDTTHDRPAVLADVSGEYQAQVAASSGVGDESLLSIAADGVLRWTSHLPALAHCQVSGALSERTPSSAQLDVTLLFGGDACQLPNGTRIQGVALVDAAARQIMVYGMDEAGGVGLFLFAQRP